MNMPRQTLLLHFNKAMDPATPQLCFVWTHDAVMGAQMFGKVVTLNLLATDLALTCHPTATMVAVLGLVCARCISQERGRVLG